ncbi:MAG TPA: uroporphyrinogen decarboxylase family protein [Anaerolineae bacterium]
MSTLAFDYTEPDAQSMPVSPVEPADFDFGAFEDHAAAADGRYAAFLDRPEGLIVWQRVRPGAVFRDACRDMQISLRLQLGALARSLAYATDAPAYLEPWYGIGTTAAAFGAEYDWLEGQAPAVRPLYSTIEEVPELVARAPEAASILKETLAAIHYFLEQTHGRLPISWSDVQAPLNVATELVAISDFFLAMVQEPERVAAILKAVAGELIRFTELQSALLGPTLARPGHGFASSRRGTGIGMSTDNLVMISPRLYERFCVADTVRVGARFSGVAIHSCGRWARWLPAVRKIANLRMVDAAFSAQTDPDPNDPEVFRDALADSGVILQARIVGGPDTVLDIARRLWAPGMRLIVVTYVQDPDAQHRLYADLHRLSEA